jgi:hypothetical protein
MSRIGYAYFLVVLSVVCGLLWHLHAARVGSADIILLFCCCGLYFVGFVSTLGANKQKPFVLLLWAEPTTVDCYGTGGAKTTKQPPVVGVAQKQQKKPTAHSLQPTVVVAYDHSPQKKRRSLIICCCGRGPLSTAHKQKN